MTKDGRIRLFELMNYEEHWNPSKAIEWLNKVNCRYIAVKHDKDEENGKPKKTHFHIVVRLKDARTLDDISFNCDIAPQYIDFVDRFEDRCAYVFHLTSNARKDGKHEYDGGAVISSKHITYEDIKKKSIEYDKKANHEEEIKQVLYDYGACKISKRDVLSKMSAEDYHRFSALFSHMVEYRIMKVRDREMKVIYITGCAGSGKTTLAKYMARVLNYDYFVSGSGKDILDGYDKEECIILDDLRADVFTKAELFKLTDNNTDSSVKSRFHNKNISFCKLMVITSIKAPHDLYNWTTDTLEDKDETFNQFARRLNNQYVYINEQGGIYEVSYDYDGSILGKKRLDFNMSQVFQVLGISKFLGADLFGDICKKIRENVNEELDRQDKDLPF